MKFTLIIALSLVLSTLTVAADTVRLDPGVDLVVNGRTDTTFELNSSAPAGDGTSDSAPARVYVPVQSGVAGQADYFLLKGSNPAFNYLFDITDSLDVILFPLYLNVSISDKYLYVAAKDGASYKLVQAFGSPINNVTNANYTFELSLFKVCAQMTSFSCVNFLPGSTTTDERSTLLYFFLTNTASIAEGDTIDPSSGNYSGGIYFELNMSNRINSSVALSINRVRQGDRRAFLEYTANATILKPKSVRVYERAASTTSVPIGSVVGTLRATEYTYNQNGEVAVTDLVNNQSYNLSVLFVDQYNFASALSPTAEASPKQIEELLKKEACFLLTAGFGEEHFVIDYFRGFRDTVLRKSPLGRGFINLYYKTAPKYALLIYQSESLRFFLRGVGYLLYFIFNYFWQILMFISFLSLCLVWRVKIQKKLRFEVQN